MDSNNVGVLWLTVNGKAVADVDIARDVAWNTAKAEYWETFVEIIRFDNITHVKQSRLILVVGSHIVK